MVAPARSERAVLPVGLTPENLGAAGMVLAVAVAVATATDGDGPVLCPFRRATTGYCPFCGGTRAAAQLVRADIGTSWRLNPLIVLLALQVPVLIWMRLRLDAERRRPIRNRLIVANLVIAVGIWATRLWTGSIPQPTSLSWPLPF